MAPEQLPRLHLITDDEVLRAPHFLDAARTILAEFGRNIALHLRGHGLTGAELYELASELRPLAEEGGAPLLINDRVDLALAAGGAGVQLGRRSLPVTPVRRLLGEERWIGYSAHSVEEVERVGQEGADFAVYGTIFPSATHPGEPTAGLGGLRKVAEVSSLPLIAIGGMRPESVREVRAAGAYGLAVLGAVWHEREPAAAVARFQREIEEV